MKVLFLDFDGPIIPSRTFALNERLLVPCATSGALINLVISAAKAKLVISSSWKQDGLAECSRVLEEARIDVSHLHEDWCTGVEARREDEILKWVESHDVDDWLAVDDMPLKLPKENFVHVTTNDGFLFDHYWQACRKLATIDFPPSNF